MENSAISNKHDLKSRLSLLLSHHSPDQLHRTIHISLCGRSVFLCARGVGRYSGLFSAVVASQFLTLPTQAYLLIFLFFPLPSTLDWATQKLGLRESRNTTRVFTGFLVGISQGFLLISLTRGLTLTSISGLVVLAIYFTAFCLVKKAWKCRGKED